MSGQKLSIVTDKPQTTRHRIPGICSDEDYQIDEVLEEVVGSGKDELPVLLVLNKKDLINPGEIAKKLEMRSTN